MDGSTTPLAETPKVEPVVAPVRRGPSVRVLVGLAIIAFLLGLAAMGWAVVRWEGWPLLPTHEGAKQAQGAKSSGASPATGSMFVADPDSVVTIDMRQQALDGRLASMEERLARITLEAQAASGNAARAEGLLVAFAARRALDGGAPLGYLEGQLKLRFGQAQPRAVATILSAARSPVTIEDLRAGLDDIGPTLIDRGPSSDWWADVKRGVNELVTFRRAGAPSPLPERRLRRAERLIDAGRIDVAMAEVNRMPGRDAAQKWMDAARRYNEARRALELIETAAVLDPHPSPATARTSPLPAEPVVPDAADNAAVAKGD